jgi:hypothetical protein
MGNDPFDYGWTSLGKTSLKNKCKKKMVEEKDSHGSIRLKEAQEVNVIDVELQVRIGKLFEKLKETLMEFKGLKSISLDGPMI